MLDGETARELAQIMNRFLDENCDGYQVESTREHAVSFTISVFSGQSVCLKIDLLLSPYYANQKMLLDSLSEYKSEVERQRKPDHLWKGIVHMYVRLHDQLHPLMYVHTHLLRHYLLYFHSDFQRHSRSGKLRLLRDSQTRCVYNEHVLQLALCGGGV